MKTMKTMIVDDSLLFREILHQELIRDVNIQVASKVADAFEAGKRIVELAPDVIIVDVIMDKLNGVDFIRQLLPQYFLPVIMVSSDHSKRLEAESIQSVTFIDKPSEAQLRQTDLFFNTIIAKIRSIANDEPYDLDKIRKVNSKIIAVGASTGGAEAIESLLVNLPSNMPPIVISQHMPPKFTKSFAERLNARCRLSVKEAENGDVVIPGQAYIAPGGYHMSIRRRNNRFIINCDKNMTGSPVCPSVDVLFHSVAAQAADCAMGVLLTGMGRDGAEGMKAMRDAGIRTVGQDEASSVVYGMPKAAFELGAVQTQLPLRSIPKKLIDWSYR